MKKPELYYGVFSERGFGVFESYLLAAIHVHFVANMEIESFGSYEEAFTWAVMNYNDRQDYDNKGYIEPRFLDEISEEYLNYFIWRRDVREMNRSRYC